MSLCWNEVNHAHLRHKILLLQLLNNTPEKPSLIDACHEEDRISAENSHLFSLQRERELAESFAFLAATTDDPKKVIAACVEEQVDKTRGLTIRLAVNRGDLGTVKAGMKQMTKVLERVAREGRLDIALANEDALLREAVRLNQNRILIRLRSSHAILKCDHKKSKLRRLKIIPQLHTAVTASEAQGISWRQKAVLKRDVNEMHKLFAELEKLSPSKARSAKGLTILIQIVILCQSIHSQKVLCQVLERSTLDSSFKESLPMAITKLGRYVSVCGALLQSARRYRSLFSRIQIDIVSFNGPEIRERADIDPTTTDAINRLLHREPLPKALRAILSKSLTVESVSENIQEHIQREASTAVPVHAEIKLLFHYECATSSDIVPPRIICSSKQACFLCNLFFQLHGKFIVPSTHGRVYEKWTLPEVVKSIAEKDNTMLASLSAFITAIDEAIAREIQSPRNAYPNPYESIILFSPSGSEMHSTRAQLEARESLNQENSARPTGSVSHKSLLEVDEQESAKPNASRHLLTEQPEDHPHPPEVATTSQAASLSYIPLEKGQPICHQLCPIPSQQESSIVQVSTPHIHLAISYEYAEYQHIVSNSSDGNQKHSPENENHSYWVIIEYLLPAPSEIPDGSNPGIREHNVDSVSRTVHLDHSFESTALDYDEPGFPKTFHVCRKSDTVAITYCLHEPVL